jgi:hypothetical protein
MLLRNFKLQQFRVLSKRHLITGILSVFDFVSNIWFGQQKYSEVI